MEYVDGAPIRPVPGARKLLDLAVQIADGLAAAFAPRSYVGTYTFPGTHLTFGHCL